VKSSVNLWPKIERGNHENKEDVEKAFILAYKSGCKVITVYRDKSRMSQALPIECHCEETL